MSGRNELLPIINLDNVTEFSQALSLYGISDLPSQYQENWHLSLFGNPFGYLIASLITEKNKFKNLVIFSDFSNEIKKTKEMSKIINKFEINNSLIILDKKSKDKIFKATRNIPSVKVTDVNHFSAYDIIKFKKVVFTESSVKELEKRYS